MNVTDENNTKQWTWLQNTITSPGNATSWPPFHCLSKQNLETSLSWFSGERELQSINNFNLRSASNLNRWRNQQNIIIVIRIKYLILAKNISNFIFFRLGFWPFCGKIFRNKIFSFHFCTNYTILDLYLEYQMQNWINFSFVITFERPKTRLKWKHIRTSL